MSNDLSKILSYFQTNALIPLMETTIVSALSQQRNNYYNFAKHIHKTIELYEITAGSCKMKICNQTLKCETGDFIIILPNAVHSFYLESEGPCIFNQIHFNTDLFSRFIIKFEDVYPTDIISALLLCCNFFYKSKTSQCIHDLISYIIEETAKNTSFSNAYSNLHITELILYIIEEINNSSFFNIRNFYQNTYISHTLSYIQENYMQKILISDIAKHLNISANYLSKVFLDHMNLTILNYVNIYRLNQAIDLMINTDLNLTTIAIQIGLKDSQHFSKLFLSIIGITPFKYRKLLKHDELES